VSAENSEENQELQKQLAESQNCLRIGRGELNRTQLLLKEKDDLVVDLKVAEFWSPCGNLPVCRSN